MALNCLPSQQNPPETEQEHVLSSALSNLTKNSGKQNGYAHSSERYAFIEQLHVDNFEGLRYSPKRYYANWSKNSSVARAFAGFDHPEIYMRTADIKE